ncbi:MAG TPA: hypothetical protein VFX50_18125 [Gemmatimonadales bacterium]|nr:hypothetical protein [Gemmatimonadales bacterium]
MRLRTLATALVLAIPAPVLAQEPVDSGPTGPTGDQARLIFSVTGGYAFGHSLWAVNGQPVIQDGFTDLLSLERNLTGTWTAGLAATYFRGPNLGFTVDAHLVDLRYEDSCRLLSNSGSELNPQICQSIDGETNSAMSAALSAGVILRAASRQVVSPYARLQVGGFFGNLNTTAVTGSYLTPSGEPSFVFVYPGGSNSQFTPTFAFGAGITVPISRAYHFRLEGRASTFGLQVVDGATLAQDVEPPTSTQYLTQFSLHAGIDLVLERKRGRRY